MTAEWTEEYQRYLENPPGEGVILTTYGKEPARIDIDLQEGKPPFIYGRAYIPCVVGQPLGWYLQPFDVEEGHGWKCILLPRAREELLRTKGLRERKVSVTSLRVVRVSKSGKALLCEVEEY